MSQFSLDEFMVKRGGSVDPSRFVDETFELFSIPAFDTGIPEIVEGRNIGSSKKCIEPNDILLSKIVPHIRRCCVVPPKGKYRQIASGEWIQFRSDQLYSQYLKFFLISDTFHWQFMHTVSGVGGSLMRASPSLVAKIKVPVPPIAEQQKIASILDAADNLRQKDQQLIEKYTALSQSLFLEMFGDPVSNPMGWDKKPLKDVGIVRTGNTPARENLEYFGTHIEWIKTTNINTPSMYLTQSEEYLSEEGLKVGRSVNAGSLLVTCIAGSKSVIGNVSIADRKVAFNQQINSFTPHEGNVLFFYSLFKAGKKHIQSFSTDSMKGMINKSKFESIDFIIPPIELQNQFAERILAIEAQKQLALASLEKSAALFNSLLQRAFKGELTV